MRQRSSSRYQVNKNSEEQERVKTSSVEKKECPLCGAKNPNESKFCVSCSAKF